MMTRKQVWMPAQFKHVIKHVPGEVQCFLMVRDMTTRPKPTETAIMMTQDDRDRWEKLCAADHPGTLGDVHKPFEANPNLTLKEYLDSIEGRHV